MFIFALLCDASKSTIKNVKKNKLIFSLCGIGVGRVKHIHSLKILRSRNIYTEHLGILAEKSEGDIDNLLKGTILTFAKEVLC